MKKIGLLVVLMISLIACSSDDNDKETGFTTIYEGKWELTQMITNFNPAANSVDTPQWKETYSFSNGKFTKTRIKDNKTTTVSGTYTEVVTSSEFGLELVYKESSDIVGSCTSLKENLSVNSLGKLNNSLRNCDGPMFVYTKIK
ncbi:hypothetical protein ACFSJW_01240 [Flavobacterium artemisiae]|uniref:Lipocalin-like domain-containing protein n=1 Tax=Flavobacterium artemisiae TaxID=2126556 RepID=A0ABW4HJC5_9FLAO